MSTNENKLELKLKALHEYLAKKVLRHPHVYTQIENAISFALKGTVNYDKGEEDFVLNYDEKKGRYTEHPIGRSK